ETATREAEARLMDRIPNGGIFESQVHAIFAEARIHLSPQTTHEPLQVQSSRTVPLPSLPTRITDAVTTTAVLTRSGFRDPGATRAVLANAAMMEFNLRGNFKDTMIGVRGVSSAWHAEKLAAVYTPIRLGIFSTFVADEIRVNRECCGCCVGY